MRRIMLTVAFDGTNYSGWQIQPNKETIEGVLNRELSRLLNEEIKVVGASRTDSGVHAEGAVCVFDTESKIPGDKFSYAINQKLPEDIRIRNSKEVDITFHPRRVNSRKTYRYRIRHDEFPNPLDARYSYHVYTKLDIEAMRRACEFIKGKHDFKSFCSVHTDVDTTVRTVYDVHIDVTPDKKLLQMSGLMKSAGESGAMRSGGESTAGRIRPEIIDIYVTGNGFLYNMVRIIAGTLIEVGQGKIKPEEIPAIIEACDREKAGPTAPAKGLTLIGYRMM
ncbi:MAG: tRNA pseudouridine(38-40) synthase TruA [Lachnospiraceae bacterium]|nr:tRNA pseudouridine(38-40) synthase TruA [Lachnospiraceae bacterium]MCI6977342.1 tRNA pseudouridine(38-40) synthase TruA [Lachnospiraceae bacterium]MDY3253947.1 tRNA pseudouridine(38-40) synthase TruA [Lachnospiraceae bacterium]